MGLLSFLRQVLLLTQKKLNTTTHAVLLTSQRKDLCFSFVLIAFFCIFAVTKNLKS